MVRSVIYDYLDGKILKDQLNLAQCGMSGVRVAACVIASNKDGDMKSFYGSNIELARGKVYHAEEVVLIKAINEGYINPIVIVLTSNNEKYLVPLCYSCRSTYSYVDPHCIVCVVNSDLKIIIMTTVHASMNFHYESKGFIK